MKTARSVFSLPLSFRARSLAALAALAALAGAAVIAGPALAAAPVKTESGLIFETVTEGSGASPSATSFVRVHYRGSFVDGKEFDSSYSRGEPTEFQLNRVIPCWTEGVQRMKVGGKAKLTCPYTIAYGENGRGKIPPRATLNFEIELLAFKP